MLILGLGSDLIDIRRIEKTIGRFGDRFLSRVFTETERRKCDRRARVQALWIRRGGGTAHDISKVANYFHLNQLPELYTASRCDERGS